MKSIQRKFIVLILCCVSLCSVVIGGVGMITTETVIDADSAQIMNLQCSEKAAELDSLFSCIEQSVQTLGVYSLEQLESVDPELRSVVSELETGTSGSTLFTYRWKEEARSMAFRSLSNGMRLALTAPASEIGAVKNRFILQISIAIFLIASLFTSITIMMTRKLIRPLKELTTAAQRIAEGDLSISLSYQTNDEVGTLADSFQKTVSHLRRYIDYINGLAYRDALTGVKNKTAYDEAVRRMEEQIRVGCPEFAVAMFDINELKYVNDHYGHDFGDMLILDCCKLLCQVFKNSPVYRIGGDEFVIILEKSDFEHYIELLEELKNLILEINRRRRIDSKISIARGVAIYNYETDLVYSNVFKRADDVMYQNKADMKKMEQIGMGKEE